MANPKGNTKRGPVEAGIDSAIKEAGSDLIAALAAKNPKEPTLTPEEIQAKEMQAAIERAIAEHEAGKLALAVVPQQGSLFAAAKFTQPTKGWQGTTLEREQKDNKGKVVIGDDGKVAMEQYGVRISPMNAKQAAEALGLEGKDNKDLLASARLEESDRLMQGAKGTVAALNTDWTLAKLVVKRNRKGVEELVLQAKNIKRTPEREKYAKALGVPLDELDAFIIESRKRNEAKQKEQKTIDV